MYNRVLQIFKRNRFSHVNKYLKFGPLNYNSKIRNRVIFKAVSKQLGKINCRCSPFPIRVFLKGLLGFRNIKITFPKNLTRYIEGDKSTLTIIPVNMAATYLLNHSNVIVIDHGRQTIERFDPQGSLLGLYSATEVDKRLESYFKGIMRLQDYKYISVRELVGKIGPQTTEDILGFPLLYRTSYIPGRGQDRLGYCEMWSVLYILLRSHYLNREGYEIVNFLKLGLESYEKRILMRGLTSYFVSFVPRSGVKYKFLA